jgi:hypothetical protein
VSFRARPKAESRNLWDGGRKCASTINARYTLEMAAEDDREISYYRTVEDLFATLRGVPHMLSPKDFQLLRGWWRDEIPLTAVRAGVTEVFARRRGRGEIDPVVSLSYCRHAVKAHAKRIAEMRVGGHDENDEPQIFDTKTVVASLAAGLKEAGQQQLAERPRVAGAIESIALSLEASAELPPAIIEEHLYALESALLANCLSALEEGEKTKLEKRARTEAEKTATTSEAKDRTFRAVRDRTLRNLLNLPRLELDV